MAKKKPIYDVWCTTSYGTGMQAVKALNKKEAERKFKKRFPKQNIISVDKTTSTNHTYLSFAI